MKVNCSHVIAGVFKTEFARPEEFSITVGCLMLSSLCRLTIYHDGLQYNET